MANLTKAISGVLDKMAEGGSNILHGIGAGDIADDDPAKRARKKAGRKAERAKQAARKRLKVMPDPEASRTAARKQAGRRRATTSSRASTILSKSDDKLGG